MIKDERLNKMEAYINAHQYVSVDELVEAFRVSKATVRRDLDTLGKLGMVCLLRGGARKKGEVERELQYTEKLGRNREEKVRICQFASALIEEGQTIFLDTGVTAREMVPFLNDKKNIRIVTNDVWLATNLSANAEIKVTVPGGDIRRGFYTIRGSETEQFLANLYVDIAFVSIDAIDRDFGCSITNNDEVLIKQQMISHSKRSVMIADHSKFETVASWRVCPLSDISLFVTGKELDEGILASYVKQNISIQIV